ncbi:MAG: hypothetical protein U9R50_04885 [Campylobacterota bacterium]|nr:hypothetical protein [Campylobacterota bacterium]
MIKVFIFLIIALSVYAENNVTSTDSNETNSSQKLYIDHFADGVDSMHTYVSRKVKVVSSNADKQVADWAYAFDGNKSAQKRKTEKAKEDNASAAMSDYFSDFFKDETFLNANNQSYLRVRIGPEFNMREPHKWDMSISFNINLPYTEDSLKLFIGEDVDADLNDKTPDPQAGDASIGVKYFIPEFVDNLKTDFSVGITGINPFVRGQVQYPFDLYDWRLRPVQKVQYSLEDEIEEETLMYFDRRISSSEMVRLFLKRESETEKEGQRYSAQISYFNTLEYDVGFNNYLAMSGDSQYFVNHPEYIPDGHEHSGIDNYRVGMVWKAQFFREWLFYELEPIVEWDRRYYYKENYIFKAKLELWFGKI